MRPRGAAHNGLESALSSFLDRDDAAMSPLSLFRHGLAVFLAACSMNAAALLSFTDVLQRPAPKADLRIAYGKDPLQFGELWLPAREPGSSALAPVVVFIHGGCWLASLPGVELMAPLADALRRQGVAVWNIEYRRVGHEGGGYPGTFRDVALGVDHLRRIAAEQHLDLARVVISGHSAGGHLALWAAARNRLPRDSVLRGESEPLPVNAVVGLAAIPDLEGFSKYGYACGGKETVDGLVDAGRRGLPAAYADTSVTPLLPLKVRQVLVTGVFDHIVAPFVAGQYRTRAAAAGESVEVVVIPDAGHFEIIVPWSDAWKTVWKVYETALKP